MSHKEKVIITKLVQNINHLCKLSKKEVIEIVKLHPSYQSVLG